MLWYLLVCLSTVAPFKRRKLLNTEIFLIHVIPTRGLAHWVVQKKCITFSTMQWIIMEKLMLLRKLKSKHFLSVQRMNEIFEHFHFLKSTKLKGIVLIRTTIFPLVKIHSKSVPTYLTPNQNFLKKVFF